jgi:hypothetical protein
MPLFGAGFVSDNMRQIQRPNSKPLDLQRYYCGFRRLNLSFVASLMHKWITSVSASNIQGRSVVKNFRETVWLYVRCSQQLSLPKITDSDWRHYQDANATCTGTRSIPNSIKGGSHKFQSICCYNTQLMLYSDSDAVMMAIVSVAEASSDSKPLSLNCIMNE